MGARLFVVTCCLVIAAPACQSDDPATRFADFTEPLLEEYTNLEICMKTCERCQSVASCSQYCNEHLSDATPACEDKFALFLLAVQGDVFVSGQCRTAPVEYDFIGQKSEEVYACIDVHGCVPTDWRDDCEPTHYTWAGTTTCDCSKECKAGSLYRTHCPEMSGTNIDCECFVERLRAREKTLFPSWPNALMSAGVSLPLR